MSDQKQSSGSFSKNIQISLHYGGSALSTDDVRAIAVQVVEHEVEKYGLIGRDKFEQRTSEIREEILTRINSDPRREEKLQSFSEPYMHHALHEAQKAYGLTGDVDLKDILVGVVDNLSSEVNRNIRQIALHEAVEVARKLTPSQIKILCLFFLHTQTRRKDILHFTQYLTEIGSLYGRLIDGVEVDRNDLTHLFYVGCASRIMIERTFQQVVEASYAGLFARGFSMEEAQNMFQDCGGIPHGILTVCLHDAAKLQINSVSGDDDEMKSKKDHYGWSDSQVKKAKTVLANNVMSYEKITEIITGFSDDCRRVLEFWNKNHIGVINLTSVGLALAHSYYKAKVGVNIGDLEIWL